MAKMTMVQALNLALKQEMDKDDRVLVLGEDVGVDGGVFRVTNELIDKFGEERVIDTPLAETAIIGTSVGMAVFGLRPVCEIQFSGFSYMAFHQLENHAARLRGRSCGRFTCRWSFACLTAGVSGLWSTIPKAGRPIMPTRRE